MSLPRVALFLLVACSIVGGWHYYLWARLVRDPGLPMPLRAVMTGALVLLALSLPLTLFLSRRLAPGAGKPFFYLAYGWMGLGFLLFFALLAGDAVRLALALYDAATRGGAPASDERRLFVARAVGGAAALLGVGAGALGIARATAPVVTRVSVALRRLPEGLSGMRVVQLSDVHVGPIIGREYIERLVEQVNGLQPDVVVITGDLVDGSVERLREHVAPLAGLRAPHGVFFVTGNHEYYSGATEWVLHLATLGVRVLRNERVSIGGPDGAFDLAGVDDFGAAGLAPGHGQDITGALAGRDESRELVLLAHQPRSAFEAAEHGVGLMLSGHTHGGQIFPWRFFVYLQQPFVDGLHRVKDTQVFVSRGTGYWGPPMRVGPPSEVTEITLTRAAG